ncbi:spermidine synthase [Deferrisoma sp.]
MSSLPAERGASFDGPRAAPGQPFLSPAAGLGGPGLFALSAGVLAYELLLLRLFSVLMWYHFASLTIGLALLGLSLGGVRVGLRRRASPGLARRGAAGFALGVLAVVGGLCAIHASPRLAAWTLAPFHQPFFQPFARTAATLPTEGIAWRVLALAGAAGLPFLGAGVALAAELALRPPRLHRAYAWVLAGSGAGAAAVPLALTAWSAPAALALVAALAAAPVARRVGRWAPAVVVLAGLAAAQGLDATGAAELPLARGRYEPGLLAVRWNPMSRVAAYSLAPGETARPFGLSPAYRGPHPAQIGLVVDDSGYTNLFAGEEARRTPEYFRRNLVALAWHLRPGARALVVGPGGGKDVWVGLSFPDSTIRAVEINPGVVEMVEEVFAGFTGRPYRDPRVGLTVADARAFTARTAERYDVIEASAVFGRMPPAAGAFTLSEDFLHTREALAAYWARLTERGIVSITLFATERRAPRLVALARDLLDREGVANPAAHVRVVADRAVASVLVGRAPFSAADDAVIRAFARENRFRVLYPGGENDGGLLARLLEAPDLGAALAELPYDVSPPTDDRPFFYYTLRPGDFLAAPDRAAGFDNQGVLVLRTAFLGLAAAVGLGLLAPVGLRHGLPRGGGAALAYAALLGAGYMLVEIGVLKRLVLFLAHPVYAAAAVLAAFLCGSGLGSLGARRIAPTPGRLGLVLLAVAGAAALWAGFGPAWLRPDHPWGLAGRAGLAFVALLPLAVLMGIPFPAGLGLLGPGTGPCLPWAWALNGAAGVLGSVGALLVALHGGYTATLALGAGLYLAAAGLAPRLGRGAP